MPSPRLSCVGLCRSLLLGLRAQKQARKWPQMMLAERPPGLASQEAVPAIVRMLRSGFRSPGWFTTPTALRCVAIRCARIVEAQRVTLG
jgi:hypothetical protein